MLIFVLVLVLKDILRTNFKSLSLSLRVRTLSLCLSLLVKFWSLSLSLWLSPWKVLNLINKASHAYAFMNSQTRFYLHRQCGIRRSLHLSRSCVSKSPGSHIMQSLQGLWCVGASPSINNDMQKNFSVTFEFMTFKTQSFRGPSAVNICVSFGWNPFSEFTRFLWPSVTDLDLYSMTLKMLSMSHGSGNE